MLDLRSSHARRTLGALSAALLAAACTGSVHQEHAAAGGTETATAGAPAPTDAPTDLVDEAAASAVADATGPVSGGDETPAGVATLVAVRTAAQPTLGVERVVFELDGAALPAYRVAYVDGPPTRCGSGAPVTLAGDAVLVVQLHHTQAHAERGGEVASTIPDRDRRLAQPLLRQLTLICDFEGETTWALGLAGRRPFRVLELRAPTRLVVDVGAGQPARAEVR